MENIGECLLSATYSKDNGVKVQLRSSCKSLQVVPLIALFQRIVSSSGREVVETYFGPTVSAASDMPPKRCSGVWFASVPAPGQIHASQKLERRHFDYKRLVSGNRAWPNLMMQNLTSHLSPLTNLSLFSHFFASPAS